jgi:ankyrin repeat protein
MHSFIYFMLLFYISFIINKSYSMHDITISTQEQENIVNAYRAVREACIEQLVYLLEQGVSVNSTDYAQNTLLHEAVAFGNKAAVQVLLDACAEVNAVNNLGMTPLHLASFNNHESIAQLLIDYGVCINKQDSFGRTSLHYAVFNNNTNLIQVLLSAGALSDIKDKTGLSPLEWALKKALSSHEHQDILTLFTARKAAL